MWGSSEEPPGTMEAGPPESMANLKENYEQSKTQLESVKDIMLKNKQTMKKKEEELQEYAKKLSKFKTRAKKSRAHKDDATSSSESTPKSKSDISLSEPSTDVVDDISQAKTPKAKSFLLQKKLAEDRKIFEQRSKELTESKRAVEEKVEALRQQLEEKYVAPVSIVNPVLITSQTSHPILELSHVQDKDNKIAELSNKIFELEAVIIDLQDNLKEKDSVIDSKTKAITLMSADLSRKGKTTLDTLEDTKDEMRSMQENFVLVESSLRIKNDNLLKQLEEKTSQITALEENVQSLTEKLEAQKEAETVSADFSRSTMDTLADTKDAMKSMQENFVLIESSLKSKNEHLLKQLEEREIKLAEADARILSLETGMGIERQPQVEDILYKIQKLEEANKLLQDEKFELQKSISDLQDKIISDVSSGEKDNRITELEGLIEELKKSNQTLEEEYKAQLVQLTSESNVQNEELSKKVIDLEKKIQDLENEKVDLTTKLTVSASETPQEDDKVQKLTKELEELNKSMIKLKAQHKKKLNNLQKQLENFKKVSDTNAELVKLGNQVALLEEEKGNLQLSLVDFDELKASAGDWQERINDLEGKVSAQAKEIQTHIEAIAILENQKLDLMQELHQVKQEVSTLEAENAEAENLRVTAEMKVVDLEEELDSLQKLRNEPLSDNERSELQRQIEHLTQENERLSQKIGKLEELKSSSEVGSTESFVKTGSNVDSTESFEALAADTDKADLLKKIDGLTRENGILLEKLNRFEEKGSSDTGSTESFERIPEQGESTSRLENLTRENYELVVKLTKLEEKLAAIQQAEPAEGAVSRLQFLEQENEHLTAEITQLQERLTLEVESRDRRSAELVVADTQTEEDPSTRIDSNAKQTVYNSSDLSIKLDSLRSTNKYLESQLQQIEIEKQEIEEELARKIKILEEEKLKYPDESEEEYIASEQQLQVHAEQPIESDKLEALEAVAPQKSYIEDKSDVETAETIATLESEIERCHAVIADQKSVFEEMKIKLAEKEEELKSKFAQIASEDKTTEADVHELRRELEESASAIAEWKLKCNEMEDKIASLEKGKQHIEEGFRALQDENQHLIEQSEQKDVLVSSLREELESTINSFEVKIKEQSEVIASQERQVDDLKKNLEAKDDELHAKYAQLQNDFIKIDELQNELSKLGGQIQQRDATISSLTEEVETLRTNTSVIEEDLFTARHQLTDLQEKLEHSKSVEEYNHAIEQLSDKEMLVEELEGKIAQKVAEVTALKSQAESLAAENEQLRLNLQEEEHKVADLLDGNRSQQETLQNAERAKAEVENRLLELQATHEETLQQAKRINGELQDTYKLLEQLKIKHTKDSEMLLRRLEDVLEEVLAKDQEITSLRTELEEKNTVIGRCIPEDVKMNLQEQVTNLEKKLTEAEEKLQQQLEKMKKFAAVAKKKTAQVEELEVKLQELNEKWNSEKNEKEEKNRELADTLAQVQEKDNKIVDLEEELKRLQVERDEALQNLESTKAELRETSEQLNQINEECKEMSDAKDNARELNVRMQVMETEYLEQVAEINSLKTENAFLLSKQTQIHERLEAVEKESEDRRAQVEKLEKEKEIAETQRSEAQESCGQCNSRVQALEAKLQEREAEIENLDNELHNSIGNLVQMQDNLRLSTVSAISTDPALQESYNELTHQYNQLSVSSEEIRGKYETMLRDNEKLTRQLDSLQEHNVTLQERIHSLEEELGRSRDSVASLENDHRVLLEEFEKEKSELQELHAQLKKAIESNEILQHNLNAQITQLQDEKEKLVHEIESLKSVKENVAVDDGWGFDGAAATIDALTQQLDREPVNETMERQKREVIEDDSTQPPLFDASVFGAPQPQVGNLEQELVISRLRDEISALHRNLEEERMGQQEIQMRFDREIEQARATIDSLTEELRNLSGSLGELETILASKDAEIQSLQTNLSSAQETLASVKAEYERMANTLEEKNTLIESVESEKNNYLSQLEGLTFEKQEVERVINEVLSSFSIVDEFSSNTEKLQKLETKLSQLMSELEILRTENQHLATTNAAEASTNAVTDFEQKFNIILEERNKLIEELNILRASQVQKPVAETVVPVAEILPMTTSDAPNVGEITGDSMWEDDEDPWGFNDKAISHSVEEEHVHIPVVPSAEIQLQLRVDELEQKLKELAEENARLSDETQAAQVKNVKYVKKLKEYKVQFDSLQRELKSQKSIGGFGDLDSAIEEELKAQIESLEKSLAEVEEKRKKAEAEKENLLKRIDVLTAATERFTEAKEKQDTEVYIWQKRYRELELKMQQLDFGPETKDATSSPPQETIKFNPNVEQEIKDLKDSVEALAAENEELQQLLEENRVKRQTSVDESSNQLQELQAKNTELTASNDKLKSDYDHLRKQYEQSLMEANEQVQNLRHNCELLRNELEDKTEESDKIIAELNEKLQAALQEKSQLEAKISTLEIHLDKLNSSASSLEEVSALLNARDQEVASLKEELQRYQAEKSSLEENFRASSQQLTDELNEKQAQIDQLTIVINSKDAEIVTLKANLEESRGLSEKVKGLELSIEGYSTSVQEKNEEIRQLRENLASQHSALIEKEQEIVNQQLHVQQQFSDSQKCLTQTQNQEAIAQKLTETEKLVLELRGIITEKEHTIENKQSELEETKKKLEGVLQEQASNIQKEVASLHESTKADDDVPMFTFSSDDTDKELQVLKAQIKAKDEEIERLRYSVDEGVMTKMIQELQDNINSLYNEKSELEDLLTVKDQEITSLKSQLEQLKSELHQQPRKRSLGEQEELMKLQNELHVREQEMNELRYILTEKESQLKAMQQQASVDYEEHESVDRLKSELYEKQQELETLKFTVSELQSEIANLRGLERLAAEDRAAIERLNSEKEEVRRQAEETVQQILKEKESEINNLKQQLKEENENLMQNLGLRERDIENLKLQIEQTGLDKDRLFEQKNEQIGRLEAEVLERDRRLAELSIMKDTDIHNLQVQLTEKNAKLEELIALSEEEEKQLTEMRKILEVNVQQINGLQHQLEEKTKEYELTQHALQRHVSVADQSTATQQQQLMQTSASAETNSISNELDVALYMLHQRDVRCEELTHELMQLLEERDTLQLRLSNAIRVNEDLRKYATVTGSSPKKESPTTLGSSSEAQPLVENPSPSKSEGPVEIAKEALNLPIDEDKKALAQKLSQLRSVNQGRDVRLRDERELRHTQQMSLLSHGDVLSTLPPEAAARLVNANYTLSRDVQSQSSVLMNWLWGKSTPKIVHM